jgi:hypothetical protein
MQVTEEHIVDVIKKGNWMIRTDVDGKSYGGFKWNGVGKWTEAPDWNDEPVCIGGLFGQDASNYGYCKRGNRLLFCETDGHHVPLDGEKIKVRKAKILLVNMIPAGLKFKGSLYLKGCTLPDGFTIGDVGGSLDLSGCTFTDGSPVTIDKLRQST